MIVRYSPGDRLMIDGIAWAVERRVNTGYQIVGVGDGFLKVMSDAEILAAWSAGRLMQHTPVPDMSPVRALNPPNEDFSLQRKADIETAKHRIEALEAVREAAGPAPYSDKRLTEILAQMRLDRPDLKIPAMRTFRRHMSVEKASGFDVNGLLPKRRGPAAPWLGKDSDALIETVLREYLLRDVPATVEEIHSILHVRIADENKLRPEDPLPVPSRATLYRRAALIDEEEKVAAQKGRAAARKRFGGVVVAPTETEPLAAVEIDHGWFDCKVVDDKGVILGRPTLTVALDRATRMPTGYVLSWEPPSFASVMMVLRHAIRDKGYVAAKYAGQVRNAWPCFGLPATIVVDNGPEFHSDNLTNACLQAGRIAIDYAETKRPEYKGKIERFFKTLNLQLVHLLPGTTFSRVNRESDYDPDRAAIVTMEKLHEVMHRFIVDVYAQGWHRGLRGKPVEEWIERTKRHPVRLPRRMQDLDALLCGRETRKLGRHGIELFGMYYNSPEFNALIVKEKDAPTVDARYDPTNIGAIRVQHPTEPRFIEAQCANPHAEGLTLWQHRKVMDKLAEKARNAKSLDYHQARVDLRQSIEGDTRKRKGRRRMAKSGARFLHAPAAPDAMPVAIPVPEYADADEAFAAPEMPCGTRSRTCGEAGAEEMNLPLALAVTDAPPSGHAAAGMETFDELPAGEPGQDALDDDMDDDLEAAMQRLGVSVSKGI